MNKTLKIGLISLLAVATIGGGVVANPDSADATVTIDATSAVSDGALTLTGVDTSVWSVASVAAGDDLTVAVTGATDSSLVLSSTGTNADALQIDASAGGLDIDAVDDIDFTLTSDTAGEDLTIALAGTGDSSLILSSIGTGADAITVTASGTGGGIDITSDTGAIDIESSTTGDINIGAAAQTGAVNLGTGAAARTITVGNDASTKVDVDGLAIELDAGITGLVVDSAKAGAAAITVTASGTGGGIDITSDTGAIDIESSTTGDINIGAAAQTGAVNLGTGGARIISVGNAVVTQINLVTDALGASAVNITGSVTTSKGITVTAGDLLLSDGAVASAVETVATLGVGVTTFVVDSNVGVITGDGGGNTVATITGGVAGQLVVLLFVDAHVTITDTAGHGANTVDLSAAFTGADDTTLTLMFDGTSWYEVARSVN